MPLVVLFPLVMLPELVKLHLPVVFVYLPVVFCATAGARLNTAAKSPKTSTSVIAIGAFFITEIVQK